MSLFHIWFLIIIIGFSIGFWWTLIEKTEFKNLENAFIIGGFLAIVLGLVSLIPLGIYWLCRSLAVALGLPTAVVFILLIIWLLK